MRRDNLPFLLKAAIAHAQFLTIYPFVDGNGRTGRALTQALLRNKAVSSHASAPISAGILRNVSDCFDALRSFRAGDSEPIVRVFIAATHYAAATGSTLINQLSDELAKSTEKLTGVWTQSAAFKILPLLTVQPVVPVDYLVRTAGFNKMTATYAIDLRDEREAMVEITGAQRNRIWQHQGVLATLATYAEQIRQPRADHHG